MSAKAKADRLHKQGLISDKEHKKISAQFGRVMKMSGKKGKNDDKQPNSWPDDQTFAQRSGGLFPARSGAIDYFKAGAKDFGQDVSDALSGNPKGTNFGERRKLMDQEPK